MHLKLRRLHIGAKNLILIPKVSWKVLSEESWIHLGTQKPDFHHLKTAGCTGAPKSKLSTLLIKLFKPFKKESRNEEELGENNDISIWENTTVIPWYYRKRDILPFKNHIFKFVYSEHFFEHLFLDEAISLFKEIYRVMAEGSVCRTVIPDADLRVYEPPEPVGYPDKNMAWNNPDKHKTRWSFKVLDEVLKISGFDSRIGLVYCTPDGEFINIAPKEFSHEYSGCIDTEIIFDISYIARQKSLIVDAIKK